MDVRLRWERGYDGVATWRVSREEKANGGENGTQENRSL